ncbi:hypothetical protein [Tessaracoccus defluvii]|uniref:Lipoprotein n=1 Tax=Tessaracoccus defluvii TaxID=1285901 RepID=A0A7H0H6Y7_9ACTN|nr:hypothetical protein [Tessaracoccus defluvii]QNP56303.1 hypothetical protein H9L22_02170 [Tessaracoccus defluvii]
MKIVALVLLGLVALTGCSAGGDKASGPGTSSPSQTVPSLPTERSAVGEMCGIEAKSASNQRAVLPLTLFSCQSTTEWLAAVEAASFQTSPEFLAATCKGQDIAPVCADAIETGLLQSTGNDSVARLKAAAAWCGVETGVADGGSSLSFVAKGQDVGVIPECVLVKLKAPDFVMTHLGSTRAMDGQQTDEWGDLEARWTYHPDAGVNMTIIDRARI